MADKIDVIIQQTANCIDGFTETAKLIDSMREKTLNALPVSYQSLINLQKKQASLVQLANETAQFISECSRFAFDARLIVDSIVPASNTKSSFADRLMKSMDEAVASYKAISEALKRSTPLLDWLREIDLSYFAQGLSEVSAKEKSQAWFRNARELYLHVLYDAKWFPFIGLSARLRLMISINEIIKSTKTKSKNREKLIDKAIFAHFADTEVRIIKNQWWHDNTIDYRRKRVLMQAMNAYLRGEYELATICLSTMWEGFITCKAKNISVEERFGGFSEVKENMKKLVKQNNYPAIMNDFYENMVMANCYQTSEVKAGIPNRHGSAHGWPPARQRKKAALNAIVFTDFIIKLEPITTEVV